MKGIQINQADNVAVVLSRCKKKDILEVGNQHISLKESVPPGHKIALREICEGEQIVKYGYPIGTASKNISQGAWVHTHNVRTNLGDLLEYQYRPKYVRTEAVAPQRFRGYQRSNGRVGVRNEIWILPTVGCVNGVAQRLERECQTLVGNNLERIIAFTHPHGCSQCGKDLKNTQLILAGLIHNPNAGGVLVLGLGCECNHLDALREVVGEFDDKRVRFLNCQTVENEIEKGTEILRELSEIVRKDERSEQPASKLIIGLKCGGSDGLSGITANPVVGNFSDRLIAMGGASILTEVPEMFGAETILMERCRDSMTFEKTVALINEFKRFFKKYGETISDNPSPGNKVGGITTLEDKSLGCIQKGGTAAVTDVLQYGGRVTKQGLNLLSAPGNDLIASTACAAAGAQILLFTTGRGTPFACPIPTIKIASNQSLAQYKANWIDFNAASAAEGVSVSTLGESLMDYVLQIASGQKQTKSEQLGYQEIAILKDGVTE